MGCPRRARRPPADDGRGGGTALARQRAASRPQRRRHVDGTSRRDRDQPAGSLPDTSVHRARAAPCRRGSLAASLLPRVGRGRPAVASRRRGSGVRPRFPEEHPHARAPAPAAVPAVRASPPAGAFEPTMVLAAGFSPFSTAQAASYAPPESSVRHLERRDAGAGAPRAQLGAPHRPASPTGCERGLRDCLRVACGALPAHPRSGPSGRDRPQHVGCERSGWERACGARGLSS